MKSRFLLGTFHKVQILILLITLLFSGGAIAQSGYGDFIIFEDFGRAIPGDPSNHEFRSSAENNNQGDVYFRIAPLPDIISPNNLLFYRPGNPPPQYWVLNNENKNWGPQYVHDDVQKGSYSIVTNSSGYRNQYFHRGRDHTPGDGDFGYMLLVDAHSSTTLYFDREIEGLCAGTRFEFSAWVKDVNNEGYSKPRVRFDILNASNNNVIAFYESTNADVSPVNTWQQITMNFEMPEGVNKIKLRITNIVSEHSGNDIAIDDIGFRAMGPSINFRMEPQSPVCVGTTVTFFANVINADEAYPTNHFVLQRRAIGSEDAWATVSAVETSDGAEEVSFTVDNVDFTYDNYNYRVVVAGDPGTLEEEKCRVVSDPILVTLLNHQPTISIVGGDATVCVNETAQLNATLSGGVENATYSYVWEKSIDNATWEVIADQAAASISTGSLTQTTYYRVTAHMDSADGCEGAGVSEIFEVTVNPLPDAPVSDGDQVVCESDPIQTLTATVTVPDGYTVVWYDADDNVVASPTLNAVGSVTYYAASRMGTDGCESADRAAVTLTINAAPVAPEVADQVTYVGATGIEYEAVALPGHTLVWFEEDHSPVDPNEKPAVSTAVLGVFTAYVAQQNDETGCLSEIVAVRVIVNPVGISVVKSVVQSSINAPSTLDYTIEIENTGDFDLTNVQVTDVLSQSGADSQTLPIGTVTESITTNGMLEIGEKWTYTFAYDVTQSQLDNGNELVNTVSVITTELPGPSIAIATTSIDQKPDVSISKVADKSMVSAAGEVVTYTITVENTGNVTLRNYMVKDILFPDWNGVIETLVPGAIREFELEYEVTQGDIDNGGVVNVVSVGGDNPDDPTDEDEEEVPSDKRPGIEVTKVADKSTVSAAAEVVTYTITVENTGNVTLRNYTVRDILFTDWSGVVETLAPGASREFELEYEVTQDDIDNGGVVNVVSVRGDNPDDPTDEDEEEVPSDKRPGIEITKVADKSTVSAAGEVVTYTITVENTGNVTLRNYTVTDILFPGWSETIDVLAPNAVRSFKLEYTVTQEDINKGGVTNVASVRGENPGDPNDEDEVEVPSERNPAISISKKADKATVSEVGEVITYTITVTNAGNVTLTNYTVTDVLFPEWRASIETLSPGATREFELSYEVTQEDIDNGGVTNVASVSGENPGDPDDEDEVEVPVDNDGRLSIAKAADRESFSEVGVVITYTITVANTGNVTLSNVVVTDVLFPEWRETIETLAPGATHSFELKYTVTQADVNKGSVVNVARVKGDRPDGETLEKETEIEVPGVFAPVANNDEAETESGEPVTITILTNDVAGSSPIVPESVRLVDPVTGNRVTTVTIEGEGTYVVDAGGKVTFTPEEGYVGNSTVNYTVKDENGLESNEATIAVIVAGVAAEVAPTAVDDAQTTQYGQSTTIAVLTNDTEGSSPIVPATVRLIDGTGSRVSVVTIPGEGRYEVNSQGIVTFTPTDGFTGTSTVQYEVSDENGLVSNIANITVTVSARPFKIPNVFTPNGDGRNDVFEIVGIESFDRVEITIVNRWGNEVYRNSNYRNNWDGQGLNEGTFYYVIITHDGGRQERHAGWVLLKRQ